VLVLHGFGDTTRTIEPLARALHARGYDVYAPLLPGQGRTLAEFCASGRAQWLAAARQALAELDTRYERVAVVGLSMGGALATLLAAERPERLSALVLLAPYLEPPRAVRVVAWCAPVANALVPYLRAEDPRSIHDPEARERVRSHGVVTPRLLRELAQLATSARAALPAVRTPTLYVQSREDNRLTPAAAERAFARLGAPEKRLEWLTGCGHVITVDYCWPRVAEVVGAWITSPGSRDSSSPRPPAPPSHAPRPSSPSLRPPFA
jgi:carboxylesterase